MRRYTKDDVVDDVDLLAVLTGEREGGVDPLVLEHHDKEKCIPWAQRPSRQARSSSSRPRDC